MDNRSPEHMQQQHSYEEPAENHHNDVSNPEGNQMYPKQNTLVIEENKDEPQAMNHPMDDRRPSRSQSPRGEDRHSRSRSRSRGDDRAVM